MKCLCVLWSFLWSVLVFVFEQRTQTKEKDSLVCCCSLFFSSFSSTGGYVFAYAILFFSTKLDLADFVSGALYFGYMGIISALFALLTGTIGFEACFWFNRKIFGAIKVD